MKTDHLHTNLGIIAIPSEVDIACGLLSSCTVRPLEYYKSGVRNYRCLATNTDIPIRRYRTLFKRGTMRIQAPPGVIVFSLNA